MPEESRPGRFLSTELLPPCSRNRHPPRNRHSPEDRAEPKLAALEAPGESGSSPHRSSRHPLAPPPAPGYIRRFDLNKNF